MNNFKPTGIFKNRHVQSIAASLKLRRPFVRRQASQLLNQSNEIIINCTDNVRLQGFYSPNPEGENGLVILLHGWEGSNDSIYLLSAAAALFNNGFDVFRLNMRDHGTSHHLNPDLFHSCRLDEIIDAVEQIQSLSAGKQKTHLCGFSLGGNFALRVAAMANEKKTQLDSVVAVSPLLSPSSTLRALEDGSAIYKRYFINKWRTSLKKKEAFFPTLYDFSHMDNCKTLTEMTDYLVTHHSDFPDLKTYLNGYALTGNALRTITIPAHIFISKDDPVIPFKDITDLVLSKTATLTVTPHGGHCGFINGPGMKSWINRRMIDLFKKI